MKRFVCLLLSLLLLFALPSCTIDSAGNAESGEKIASYRGGDPLPLHAACSDGLWFLLLGRYGEGGGVLAVGSQPDAVTARYTLPDDAVVLTFSVEGSLCLMLTRSGEGDSTSARYALTLYDAASDRTFPLGDLGSRRTGASLLSGRAIWIDKDATRILCFDPSRPENGEVELVSSNRITALGHAGEDLIWCENGNDGQKLCRLLPDGTVQTHALPSAVALVHDITYDPTCGMYALYYTDSVWGDRCIGSWFPTATSIPELFHFDEGYEPTEHPICQKNGVVYWIVSAVIPGLNRPHYRIVAWDVENGKPSEYMRAFSFTVCGDRLTYLTLDHNRRTDQISLWQKHPI